MLVWAAGRAVAAVVFLLMASLAPHAAAVPTATAKNVAFLARFVCTTRRKHSNCPSKKIYNIYMYEYMEHESNEMRWRSDRGSRFVTVTFQVDMIT